MSCYSRGGLQHIDELKEKAVQPKVRYKHLGRQIGRRIVTGGSVCMMLEITGGI